MSQKYLIVHPEGGLGNRLRVLASASVMAKVTNRKLILDWKIDSHSMAAKFSDLFQNEIPSPFEIGKCLRFKLVWKRARM